MRGPIPLLGIVLLASSCAQAEFGPEVQVYPSGLIAAAHFQKPLDMDTGHDDFLTWRVGANLTERGDFGDHDDEDGYGVGGGIGWRRLLDEGPDDDLRWIYGARVDLWAMNIDYDDPGPGNRGSSDVLVLQPTVEGGLQIPLGNGWRMQVMAGLGFEINVATDGEDVGDGAILLIGATFLPDS